MENIDAWIGGLFLANLATIGSIIYAAGRVVWHFAKQDSRLASCEKDIDAAHEKIRWIKDKFLTNSNGGI